LNQSIRESYRYRIMSNTSDLNRGIMKFDGADKPAMVAVSAILVFSAIVFLIVWSIGAAYAI
jgi:hypothetical protein